MLIRARFSTGLSSFVITVLLAVGMAACSLPFGSSGSTGPISVSKQISAAQGGSLNISTGATLTIPANALSGDASVTLSDPGKAKHANGDPLDYVSDMFTASAKGANGVAVSLKTPATLTITPQSSTGQNIQDLIVAKSDPDLPGAIQLQYANTPATSSADTASARQMGGAARRVAPAIPRPTGPGISYTFGVLNSSMWVVGVPSLTQQTHKQAVLQVPSAR